MTLSKRLKDKETYILPLYLLFFAWRLIVALNDLSYQYIGSNVQIYTLYDCSEKGILDMKTFIIGFWLAFHVVASKSTWTQKSHLKMYKPVYVSVNVIFCNLFINVPFNSSVNNLCRQSKWKRTEANTVETNK